MIQNSLSILTVLDVLSVSLVYSFSLDSRLLVLFRVEDIIHVTPLRVLSCLVHAACMFVPWVQVFTTSATEANSWLTSSVYIGHLQPLFQAVLCPTGSLSCPSSTEEKKNPGYLTTGKSTGVLQLIGMMVSCYCDPLHKHRRMFQSQHFTMFVATL